jgi:hypothetical protein
VLVQSVWLAGQGLEPSYPTDNIQKHETRSRFQPGRGKDLHLKSWPLIGQYLPAILLVNRGLNLLFSTLQFLFDCRRREVNNNLSPIELTFK